MSESELRMRNVMSILIERARAHAKWRASGSENRKERKTATAHNFQVQMSAVVEYLFMAMDSHTFIAFLLRSLEFNLHHGSFRRKTSDADTCSSVYLFLATPPKPTNSHVEILWVFCHTNYSHLGNENITIQIWITFLVRFGSVDCLVLFHLPS